MTNRCDVKFPISTGLLSRSRLTKEPWLNYSTVSPSVLQIHGRTQPAFNTGDVNDTLLKKYRRCDTDIDTYTDTS